SRISMAAKKQSQSQCMNLFIRICSIFIRICRIYRRMDSFIIQQDLYYLIRVGVAMLLCAVIGYDRERGGKPAGLRTHTLVGLGASSFVVLGELLLVYFTTSGIEDLRYDPIRILEAVVAGVAFL